MNRRPSSFRSLAVAATADSTSFTAAAMSSRPFFRGWRPQGRRGYSERPLGRASEDHSEFVSADSHFGAVRDANRGFRPSYNAVPPPPQYVTGQQFYGPGSQSHRPGPPFIQPPGPRPWHPRQAGPAFGNYQQFRPQQMRPQFRPRASKPPDYREWEYGKPVLPPHCERFTVLSYNILADYLATDHFQKLYFHIPRYIMDWNWRKRNISFELGLWSADILCFQEVDRFQDMQADLKPRGYSGIWKMRTGYPADGCAIFWRVSRFKLLHEESIEYSKLGLRDNVAQICVFESLKGPNNSSGASTLSTSSGSSNRVVFCNIHVLFNPKRGDIKLGQVRVLLDRANDVSKLWDDAPIVICGDFNCTPKSPMYNFIQEQKLDLSKLARDKISGQESAEIRPPRPAYPDFRTQSAADSIQAFAVNSEKIVEGDLPSDAQKLVSVHGSIDAASTGSYSKPGFSVMDETCQSYIGEESRSRISNDLPSHDAADSSSGCVPHDVLIESLSSAQDHIESSICPTRGTNEMASLESSSADKLSKEDEEREFVESDSQTEAPDNQIKHPFLLENSSDLTQTPKSAGIDNSDTSQLEEASIQLFPNSLDVAPSKCGAGASSSSAANNHDKPFYGSASCESITADFRLDEKFEVLSLNELVDRATDNPSEDCDSFLSELHCTSQSPFTAGLDSSSPKQTLHLHGGEIPNATVYDDRDIMTDVGSSFPSSSAWTPAEIQSATGSADCRVMEHLLKLKSAYAEVVNSPELRDSSGEPLVTSYHRLFSGTVDYIWHSEGLQTVKVLAPIPKHVMQQTRGFPTKKWGSDHIALVSEFAFTKDISSEDDFPANDA